MDDVPVSPGTQAPSPAGASPAEHDRGGEGTGDSGPAPEGPVLDWWDACQLAVVFVATQYVARRSVHLLAATLNSPLLYATEVIADQLAVAIFPVAWIFRLQPQARRIFHTPNPGGDALAVIVALSLPLLCLLNAAFPRALVTYGLPLFDADLGEGNRTTAGLIATCLAGPVIDEVFFRGVLGRCLVLRYRPLLGALLTSGIFAASRLSLSGFVPVFLLGLSCHVLYFACRSIYAPILFHALVNCFTLSFNLIRNDRPLALGAFFW